MSKKEKKKRARSLFDRLAAKLETAGLGEVTHDSFGDKSSRWIELKKDGIILSISFEWNGEDIMDIELFKEIVEVTGQEKLLEFKKKS